jgi:hypothetical protein
LAMVAASWSAGMSRNWGMYTQLASSTGIPISVSYRRLHRRGCRRRLMSLAVRVAAAADGYQTQPQPQTAHQQGQR